MIAEELDGIETDERCVKMAFQRKRISMRDVTSNSYLQIANQTGDYIPLGAPDLLGFNAKQFQWCFDRHMH